MPRTSKRRNVRAACSNGGNRVSAALRNMPEPSDDIRWDLVNRVRAEIAAGTYDTDEKWNATLELLADELLGD